MNPRRHELLYDAVMMLKAHGATNIEHCIGGRHLKLSATYHGKILKTTMATTPSDWRARRNSRALLRRLLRAIDAKPGRMPDQQGGLT